jgi:hypothetical protein
MDIDSRMDFIQEVIFKFTLRHDLLISNFGFI